jgi:hypothetical protein
MRMARSPVSVGRSGGREAIVAVTQAARSSDGARNLVEGLEEVKRFECLKHLSRAEVTAIGISILPFNLIKGQIPRPLTA